MSSAKEGMMRGRQERQASMLLAVTVEDLVPQRHPIRRIRVVVDALLDELGPLFAQMYSDRGRPSIPPEHLLKATLLMALYSIRSERQFCERLQYDLLFKWFLGLNITDPAFDPTTFSHNRERLLRHEVAEAFLGATVREARKQRLLSEDHFTADGTLLQAWASLKSFRPRDDQEPPQGGGRNAPTDFHGQRRSNETHRSTTDPESRLACKGTHQEAKLCFSGHLLTENRNGLIVDALLCEANGFAEREAALRLVARQQLPPGATLGADKAYDTQAFVAALSGRGIVPHIAQNTRGRRSAVPGAIAGSPGYALSQRRRKLVEEPFGWLKTVAQGRKLRYIGVARNQLWFLLAVAGYNLIRLAKLSPQPA
jgi:transposase